MKEVRLTCVGKLKESYWREALAEYEKRLGKFCKFSVCELPDSALPDSVRRESESILSSFGRGEYRILCDIDGDALTSKELSAVLDSAYSSGKSAVRFIIGGSDGVDGSVKSSVDKRVSFGRVTYPHQLMRVMLAEQIYRAMTISEGLPYHK